MATSAGRGRQTPTQTGGTGLGRGSGALSLAHASSPLHQGSPSPQSRLLSEPGSSRELSAVSPALPLGMRTQLGSPQGLSEDTPGLRGWEGGRRRRGNAALPDPPSPPPPPAVRRPGGSAAWASPAALPPPSPPPTHVRAAPSALRPASCSVS